MKLTSKDGMELMTIDSIDVVEDKVVVRGKLMKTMPAVIHVEPVGLAELFMLLRFKRACRLAGLFCRGLWQYYRSDKRSKSLDVRR